jgi:hypothetical protein
MAPKAPPPEDAEKIRRFGISRHYRGIGARSSREGDHRNLPVFG